jgi:hypothetical protein
LEILGPSSPVPCPSSPVPPIYTTCLHCHRDLGANEALDHFEVGRRIAFDQRKGRLWVICTGCGRWNLSPLDERWEVIEQCERLYRDTRKRVSTDQIGLAKLPDQTTLVRIGDPIFPEYASWRYGRLFTQRDRSAVFSVQAGGLAAIATLIMVGGPVLAVSGAGLTAYATYELGRAAIRGVTGLRSLGSVTLGDGSVHRLDVGRARRAQVATTPEGRWTLALPGYGGSVLRPSPLDLVAPEEAEMAARRIMPVVNAAGGDEEMVGGAVKLHEQWEGRIGESVGELVKFFNSPLRLDGEPHLSLAFEMAVYEEQEQRWLQTELYLLKSAWKEAERIAAIADSLTLPDWVSTRVDALRQERE